MDTDSSNLVAIKPGDKHREGGDIYRSHKNLTFNYHSCPQLTLLRARLHLVTQLLDVRDLDIS